MFKAYTSIVMRIIDNLFFARKFYELDEKRNKEDTSNVICGSLVDLYYGIVCLIFPTGLFFLLILVILDDEPTPWIGVLIALLVCITPLASLSIYRIKRYLRRITIEEDFFIYKNNWGTSYKVYYCDITRYKSKKQNVSVKDSFLFVESRYISDITIFIKSGEFKEKCGKEYHFCGLIGLYKLQEQFKNKGIRKLS